MKAKMSIVSNGYLRAVIFLFIVMMAGVSVALGGEVRALSLDDNLKINPVYEQYVRDVAEGNGGQWSLIPNKYVSAGNRELGYGGDFLVASYNFPSYYNLVDNGYATRIKDQGADGTCWAYAWTTAMESKLLFNDGLETNFSAKQYDYILSEGTKEYAFLSEEVGGSRQLGGGGNAIMLSYALSGSYSPIADNDFFGLMKENDISLQEYESFDEYQDWARIKSLLGNGVRPYRVVMESDKIESIESDYVIAEYTGYFPDAEAFEDYGAGSLSGLNTLVKQSIRENGAMYVGTFGPGGYACYDEETNTIIDRGEDVCGSRNGHAMAIVGWDDDHAYTDPATGTVKTGAFILQNSWGKNSLFADYGITYDTAVEQGLINPDELTETQIEYAKDFIENYEAPEFIYLAYEYEELDDNGATINFFSADKIVKNDYKNIYDYTKEALLSQEDEGFGAVSGDEENEIVYTYSTEPGETEIIDAVAVESHMAFYIGLGYEVEVDTGDGFKNIGSVEMMASSFGKRMIEVKEQMEVSGEFKVKYKITYDDEPINVPMAFYPYFTTTVYTKAVPEEEPEPDEEELGGDEEPDEKEEEVIEVPNTGRFSGLLGGAVMVVPAIVIVLGLSFLIVRAYKGRKELFHSVKFDKK